MWIARELAEIVRQLKIEKQQLRVELANAKHEAEVWKRRCKYAIPESVLGWVALGNRSVIITSLTYERYWAGIKFSAVEHSAGGFSEGGRETVVTMEALTTGHGMLEYVLGNLCRRR